MNIKKDLLAEIEAKANKIKDRKNKAKSKEDLEKVVFKFFEEAELMGKMKEPVLIIHALGQLRRVIQVNYDHAAQVEGVWNDNHQIQGVMITWSKSKTIANQGQDQLYIGVEQMLFS